MLEAVAQRSRTDRRWDRAGTKAMRRLLCAVSIVLIVAAWPSAAAAGDSIEVASVASDGTRADSVSFNAALNSDGQIVAFWSGATNLVSDDENGAYDVFVRDRSSGTTERVSVSSDGSEGNADSTHTAVSRDGRFVAFISAASNLVSDDTNEAWDVFVRDRRAGTTERVSVASDGTAGNGHSDRSVSISDDGRYVVFSSTATNLVADDTNEVVDVFLHDRVAHSTIRVSVSNGERQGDGDSDSAVISGDGGHVAFRSEASNLVRDDANEAADIFVRDLAHNTTKLVSISNRGRQGNRNSTAPSISRDGRFIAFGSGARSLTPGDTNEVWDIFVRDQHEGTTTRVNLSSDGEQTNAGSDLPSISADGRYVAFRSRASNLVADDNNWSTDVFVNDRLTGTTHRISVSSEGAEGFTHSDAPSISADGKYVAFESGAENFDPDDTNWAFDIFIAAR